MFKGTPSGYDKMAAVIVILSKKQNLKHDSVATALINQAENSGVRLAELKSYGLSEKDARDLMALYGESDVFTAMDANEYLTRKDPAGWASYLRQKDEWAGYREDFMTMNRPPVTPQLEIPHPHSNVQKKST